MIDLRLEFCRVAKKVKHFNRTVLLHSATYHSCIRFSSTLYVLGRWRLNSVIFAVYGTIYETPAPQHCSRPTKIKSREYTLCCRVV